MGVNRGMDKAVTNAMYTEDSYGCIGIKDTQTTSVNNTRIDEALVAALFSVILNSVQALTTALTPQLVSKQTSFSSSRTLALTEFWFDMKLS